MANAMASKNPEELEEPDVVVAPNSAENFVTCIHRAKIAGHFRYVGVTWSKTLIGHSLFILVESPSEGTQSSCKIDLKTWQFWGKKGLKSFKVDDKRVDVYWDLRTAKFASSPEPNSDYYVALVASDKEMVLLLGDQKKEAFQRTKSRPSSENSALVHKKENVFAKKCFCSKTMLGKGSKEHHIIIECATSGPYDPEMWISVDGIESIRISNLHWRFRGNETIKVDGVSVQIFWDVLAWLYHDLGDDSQTGPGTFIFIQGTDPKDASDQDFARRDCISSSENSDGFNRYFEMDHVITAEFCHFLYAWKTG